MWPDPQAEELPDEYQVRLRVRLLALIEAFANGEELLQRSYNYLENSMWEFKVESVRVTFYDTDGQGNWTPLEGVPIREWDGRTRWEFPEDDFEENVRLGHTWGKDGRFADPEDIKIAMEVREEDIRHDA